MIKEIDFTTIKSFWANNLWLGRQSTIEPVACINKEAEIDMKLKKYTPFFWGFYEHGFLVGVISFCPTSVVEGRMRGVCILPEYRNKKIAFRLISECIHKAKELRITEIWTMARDSNINFYNRFGFKIYKKTDRFEFGPHTIMNLIHF